MKSKEISGDDLTNIVAVCREAFKSSKFECCLGKNTISLINDDTVVANAIVIPVKQHRVANKTKSSYSIELIVVSGNRKFGPIVCKDDEIDKSNFLQKYFGLNSGIVVHNPKLLKESILILAKGIETESTFAYTGFNDDADTYIFNGEQIYSEDDQILPEVSKVACDFVMEKFLAICPQATLLFLYQLLGLTTTLLAKGRHQVQFVQFLLGRTGSCKTTLAMLFSNTGLHDQINVSFEASLAKIYSKLKAFSDVVAIIDDFKPPKKGKQKEFDEKLEMIVRSIGDIGNGKANMRDDKPIKCLPLITGEEIRNMPPSSYARLHVVEIDQKDVNLELLTECQNNTTIYDNFLQHYICYIIRNQEGYVDNLTSMFSKYRDLYMKQFPDTHRRIICIASWLIAIHNIFYFGFATSVGSISKEAAEQKCFDFKVSMEEYMSCNAIYNSNETYVDKFFKGISHLIKDGKAIIVEQVSLTDGKTLSNKAIAITDGKYIYLRNSIIYEKVRDYYGHVEDFTYNISDKQLRVNLYESKLIPPTNGDNLTLTKSIAGNREQVTKLYLNKFNEKLGGKNDYN